VRETGKEEAKMAKRMKKERRRYEEGMKYEV
jgi:hypothetical protein